MLGSNELIKQVIEQGLCVNCGGCSGLCSHFGSHRGRAARIYACDRPVGACYASCPMTGEMEAAKNFESRHPLGNWRSIKLSRSNPFNPFGGYQNGGTVSTLMKVALEHDVVRGAVLTGSKGIRPMPRLITEIEEVDQCSSSKYIASPTVGKLLESFRSGKRRLGLVGTPCQLEAINRLKNGPAFRGELGEALSLTIGLFCSWSFHEKKLTDFLKEKTELSGITGMEILPPPQGGLVIKGKEEITLPVDMVRPLMNRGCLQCKDLTSELADISVGAFEEEKHWNILIIRSEQGERLVAKAQEQGSLVLKEMPDAVLERLMEGAKKKKTRITPLLDKVS